MNAIRSSLAAVLAGALLAPMAAPSAEASGPAALPLPVEGELPALSGAIEWLNSPPLTATGLRGKVVVVEFWTYSCINWLRTMPYVRAWAEKYKAQGLVVIGVHTPEFDFEKDVANVRRAATEMKVDFPIAIDSDHVVWRAFDNEYWPALYFIDAKGRMRHHHFGEGDYDGSERVIQQLLAESGAGDFGRDLVAVEGKGAEAAPDWERLRSGENYLGVGRTQGFASPGGGVLDKPHVYTAPARLALNQWALSGDWTLARQVASLNQPHGRIVYRFHARDLHLVMGPTTAGAAVRFRVLVDGRPPGADHGFDIDAQGFGTATEPRLYQLIRQRHRIKDRQFEIEFLDPGVGAFSFTFG